MDNTIALLSNILKKLDIISQQLQSSSKPSAQGEAVQKSVINNKTTGLSTAPNPQATVKTIQPTVITNNIIKTETDKKIAADKLPVEKNISIKDVVDFLGALPKMVKAVTGLHGLTLRQFSNVLSKVAGAISDFVKKINFGKFSNAASKQLKNTVDSIAILGDSIKKIALLAPFIPLFNLSMKLMLPGVITFARIFRTLSRFRNATGALVGIAMMNTMIKSITVIVASTVALALAIKVLGIGPILAGLGTTLAIITSLSALALVIAGVSKHFALADVGFIKISAFIFSMILITGATAFLGVFVAGAAPLIAAGFAAVLAMTVGYTALALGVAYLGTIISGVEKIGSFVEITKFIAWNIALTGATVLLGALITQGWQYALAGFAGIAMMTAGYTTIAFGLLALGTKLGVLDKSKSLIEVTKFIAWCIGLGFATVILGKFLRGNEATTAEAFVLVGAIITGTYFLAKEVATITKGVTLQKAAVGLQQLSKFMLLCGAVAAEIILVGAGIKAVGSAKVWEAFGLFTAIVTESALLASLANTFKSQIQKGAAAFGQIGLLMAGVSLALIAIVKTLKIKQDNNIEWTEILISLGMMAAIVVEFAALAIAISSVGPAVTVSLPFVGMIGLLAVGSALILGGVVKLVDFAKRNLGDNWAAQSLGALGLMGTVVAEFAVLAGAISLATIPIAIALPGIAIIEGFAFATVKLLNKIVDLQIKLTQNNLTKTSITGTIDVIKSAIHGFVDLISSVSFGGKGALGKLAVMGSTLAKGAALTILMQEVASIVTALGSIALIATPDGKIRPAKFVEDRIVAGEPVDILASAKIIVATVKEFTSLITTEFNNISLKDMVRAMLAMRGIKVMLDPISNFVNALMSFDSGDGETLHTVKITDDGKVVVGPDIHLAHVANIIAKAVGTFANALFSKENAETWKRMTEGGTWFTKSPAQKAMGIFATVIDPVCAFADTLSKFAGNSDGKTLTIIEFDETGKEKNRRNIDVTLVSTAIANAVTTFVQQLAAKKDVWAELLETRKTKKGLGIFGEVVDPVSNFVEMLSKFSVSANGELKVIDSKGVERTTNLTTLATKITSAISSFVTSITNIDLSNAGNTETLSQILRTSFTPVNDFVAVLSKYKDVPAGFLPLFDNAGNIIENIDVTGTSSNIINSIKAFSEGIVEIQTSVKDNSESLSIATASVSKYIKQFSESLGSKKATANLKNFADTVKTDTSNLKEFDNVLSNGNRKRIQDINSLAEAVKKLNNEFNVSGTSIAALRDLFDGINSLDSSRIQKAIEEINKIRVSGNNGGGGGTSVATIKKAIIAALDDATLMGGALNVQYGTGSTANKIVSINMGDLTIQLDDSTVTKR